ncbi:MAG: DNA-processing protein DprA, partial [Ilumatobacteraceae bacterium]
HGALWEGVCNCGLLLTEAPPGAGPVGYRFPLRNRLIAALSEVVVVVESRQRGGSLITASEALERGVPLMAVPGPPAARAAAGTNELLRDGAAPVLDAGDVLAVLAIEHRRAGVPDELRPRPRPDDIVVYDALGAEPRTVEGISLACGVSLVEAAMRVARLEQSGWVAGTDGWFEQIGSPLR